MQYRSFLTFIAAAIFTIAGSIAVTGQTGPANGRVELEADGKRTPVAGATVEIFRTDIKGSIPSTKTSKKGEFFIAGLLIGGEYMFSISGPNISPIVYPKVRAGHEGIVITVYPGDGRKFTEAEARQAALTATDTNAPPEMSEEERKARAELEAKNKEIEAKNEKIQRSNEIMTSAATEGTAAYNAKNYDLAIAKYTEGYEANPEFLGSAPIFLNNRGSALIARARDKYNSSAKSTVAAEKLTAFAAVKKDLADAADSYFKSYSLLKNPPMDPAQKASADKNKEAAVRGGKEAISIAVRTEQVDPSLVEIGKVVLPEYKAIESDAAKKHEADLLMADMYRVLDQKEEAASAYKKILENSPDDVDALAYAGIVLVDLAWLKDNDKALSQEGANLLQKFVAMAPDTHKLKEGAVQYLAILKEQNVVPVKAPARTPTKRKS